MLKIYLINKKMYIFFSQFHDMIYFIYFHKCIKKYKHIFHTLKDQFIPKIEIYFHFFYFL